MDKYSFEDLDAYKEARTLVRHTYQLVDKFPVRERFILSSQLLRAIISVASNIAESSGRISNKEKAHFFNIAYGSLMEAYCQFQIALDNNYITKENWDIIRPKFFSLSGKIASLAKYFSNLT